MDFRFRPPSSTALALLTLPQAQGGPETAWRSLYAGLFDVGVDAPLGAKGDFVARSTGNFILSETDSPRLRLVRSSETIRRGGAEGFAIHVQISGTVAGTIGDKTVECRAGDVFFLDLLQTLDLQITPGEKSAAAVALWIPRRRMLASIDDENALHGFVVRRDSPAAALIGGSLRLFAQQAGKLTAKEMDALADGVAELAVKSIAPLLPRTGGVDGGKPLASFVTIRHHIDQTLRSPALGVETLATTFGLSRASLYRLFEPVGGVASYIRKSRLNRAYQDIVAAEYSNRRIGPIAYRLGFKNLSAFNRLFKETYGVSPKEARERAIHGFAGAPPSAEPGEATSLGLWLARLSAVSMGENVCSRSPADSGQATAVDSPPPNINYQDGSGFV
jgi:AraC-like DNA-binding protein